MDPEDFTMYADEAVALVMLYAPKVVLAVITLVVGLWLIGRFGNFVGRSAAARGVDPTLTPFLTSIITWTLRAMVLISVASMVGVQTTSFVAILGAAGLAVGLAL